MVQLRIISGQLAGENIFVRQFPFYVGRGTENQLTLGDDGVWEQHFALDFQREHGFTLQTFGEAFTAINEQAQTSARLRNGDVISFGSAKIQFWLAPVIQKNLFARECLVWLLIASITALQIFLLLKFWG